MKFNTTLLTGALCAGLFCHSADATIVTLDTSIGPIDINLYDATTPATVANFLAYVNAGTYENTFVHRSIAGFIVQAGGFEYSEGSNFDHVTTFDSVVNEPKLSNVRGSISMAKLPGQPNSATSEFFFNLTDNVANSAFNNLDASEEGYTVFGQLTADSLAKIDEIAGLTVFNYAGFSTLPLQNFTPGDGMVPSAEHFILINSATISDAATDTAATLNPVANPNFGSTTPTPTGNDTGSSSGNMGIFSLLMLAGAGFLRRLTKISRA